MTSLSTWTVLFGSLWDSGHGKLLREVPKPLPGVNLDDWIGLVGHDWDDADRLLHDYETIGG